MWPTPTSLDSDTPSPPSPRPTSESMGSLVHILKRKKAVWSGFQPSWAGVILHYKHGPSPGHLLPAPEGVGLHPTGKFMSQHTAVCQMLVGDTDTSVPDHEQCSSTATATSRGSAQARETQLRRASHSPWAAGSGKPHTSQGE